MRSQVTEQLEVRVTEPSRLYELLDGAEAMLRQVAMPERYAGILVTRHEPGRYTLALSNTVPFGETREQILS
ncbi:MULTISPECIES: hypothetical protein [Arthrobacter]|uniref:Uncharacterized protein n=1 Tax=Arthrobacter terricola TaxID=2547396 RepID=A0A4R5K6J3_9MICC|nr:MULTISPECIES: hypothetical protein [Arthrobacter]MBT8163722.1 hypothetical protein [Arthrobacter sp. GN70]TDF87340.1 hypothetical protein E1809_25035 [Arthrobacter terricola]